jgi:UDP-glucose 6-dehydrogenase
MCNSQEDYETIRQTLFSSNWVAPMHTNVPNNGKYGFSGACLPKDLEAFTYEVNSVGLIEEAKYLGKCSEINEIIKRKLNSD